MGLFKALFLCVTKNNELPRCKQRGSSFCDSIPPWTHYYTAPQSKPIQDYWLSRAKCALHTPCSVGSCRYTSPRLGSLSNRHNHGIDISWESGAGVFSGHQGTSGDFLKWIYHLTCLDFQCYRSSHKPRHVPFTMTWSSKKYGIIQVHLFQ